MLLETASQNNPGDARYTALLSSQVLAEQTGLATVFALTFILTV